MSIRIFFVTNIQLMHFTMNNEFCIHDFFKKLGKKILKSSIFIVWAIPEMIYQIIKSFILCYIYFIFLCLVWYFY